VITKQGLARNELCLAGEPWHYQEIKCRFERRRKTHAKLKTRQDPESGKAMEIWSI
jgi:hypothetical protein